MVFARWVKLFLIAFLFGAGILYVWVTSGSLHWQAERVRMTGVQPKKKVILLLVDSLLSRSLEQLAERNEAPAFQFLWKNGRYRGDVISSFPTMSVTIDSTLLTGAYPDQHRIPGLLWFHEEERRMVDYGDGLRVVWKPGMWTWFTDSFYRLNQQHLSRQTKTIHEELAARGYTSGSINGLLYRGSVPHYIGIKGLYQVELHGPDLLALGALARVTKTQLPASPFQSMGLNSAYTAQSLISLIKENRLPDVTLAYFPDLDGKLHQNGPNELQGVRELDGLLQEILNAFGSWEEALQQCRFVLIGDSGVTETARQRDQALIRLETLLDGYRFYRLGNRQAADDDVAVAINGRMAYLYTLSPRVTLSELVDRLKKDARIDLIAWKENDWIHVQKGNRRMQYRSGQEKTDRFGQQWEIRGETAVMDLKEENGTLSSPLYPDGLKRLESAFHSHSGRFLIVTAKPGAEFAADGAPNHPGGGNHGSLDASDSLIPLLVAPAEDDLPLPGRIVEMKPYLLKLLERQ